VSGEIVVAGNHATDDVMTAWARKFAQFHPGVRLRLRDDTRLTTDAFDAAIAAGERLVPGELAPDRRALRAEDAVELLERELGERIFAVEVHAHRWLLDSDVEASVLAVDASGLPV